MIKPYKGTFPITQNFGENPEMYTRFGLKAHNGQDVGMPTGTQLIAPIPGKIIEATFDANGYGNYIKIENDLEGVVLAHLSKITVSVGFTVKEGDPIGLSGSTGNSTGPHLHTGYYRMPRDRSNGYAGFIDPLPYLKEIEVKTYTEEEYQAAMTDRMKFWGERDAALTQVTEIQQKLNDVSQQLSAIQAVGVASVEELQKERSEYNAKLEGFGRELTQVLDRNKSLAEQLAKKETEDATAIEEGLKAMKKAKQLEDDLYEIRRACGANARIDIVTLVKLIFEIKTKAERMIRRKDPVVFGAATPVLETKEDKKDFWAAIGLGGLFSFIFGATVIVLTTYFH